jgi:hypothetical protein
MLALGKAELAHEHILSFNDSQHTVACFFGKATTSSRGGLHVELLGPDLAAGRCGR